MLKAGVALSTTQKNTVEWMIDRENKIGCGSIGHLPGLGKTLSALALTMRKLLSKKEKNLKDLYIVPPSLADQWVEQTEALTTLTCAKYLKNNDSALWELLNDEKLNIIIVSYDIVTRALDDSLIFNVKWERIVADEAHRLRNPQTITNQKLCQLNANYIWALSGTFLINQTEDYYGICKFIKCKGHVSKKAFWRRMRNGKLLSETLLQSTEEDVKELGLAHKEEHIHFVPMSEKEALSYKMLKNSIRNKGLALRKGLRKGGGAEILQLIHKLRIAANDISLLKLEDSKYMLPPDQKVGRKIKFVLELIYKTLKASPERKILVFSNFLNIIEHYRKYLSQIGISALTYTGEITKNERSSIIDRFKNDPENRYPVLILGYKIAAAGLNLQCSNMVILNEPFWNISLETQAIARSYRKGQTQAVDIHRVYAENTIEGIVRKIGQKKEKAIVKALSGGRIDQNQATKQQSLSTSEIDMLLQI